MVTVKELKPYHIKTDADYVYIILAYQYFTISIDDTIYKFVPVDAKEIIIDRRTKQIQNVNDMFAFQKEKKVIYVGMNDLLYNPEFLIQIHSIADPYYLFDRQMETVSTIDVQSFINELEQQNVKRLIDRALDDKDITAFYKFANYLQSE